MSRDSKNWCGAIEGRPPQFLHRLNSAVSPSMVSFIAVGTPMSENGAADLSGVLSAAEEIAKEVSRLPYHRDQEHRAGRHQRSVREIVERKVNHRIDVCSVPEFLKEGSAIEDFMRPTAW